MAVLRRKYGFEDKPGVTRTVQQEMDLLNIPDFIQKTVQYSLYEQGKDNQTNVNSYNLLLEQEGVDGQGSCYEFIEGLKHLNETELCAKFGLDPVKLRSQFENLVLKILSILKNFQSGNSDVLPQNINPATILSDNRLADKLEQPSNLDISTTLKILFMLQEKFQSSLLFSKII